MSRGARKLASGIYSVRIQAANGPVDLSRRHSFQIGTAGFFTGLPCPASTGEPLSEHAEGHNRKVGTLITPRQAGWSLHATKLLLA